MINTNHTEEFHSNGKLLLTGEFLVIDGAKALALPCRFGQNLRITPMKKPEISWKSFTKNGTLWYEAHFSIGKEEIRLKNQVSTDSQSAVTRRLIQLLNTLFKMRPEVFSSEGMAVETRLEFPRGWGLGSSSTLLVNLANWAKVNPYELSAETFGGSAYDIACATSSSPLLFQWVEPDRPNVDHVDFSPPFRDKLFFVYQNHKQNTRQVVQHYKDLNPGDKSEWIAEASALTNAFLNCTHLSEFEDLMELHEKLLSKVLAIPPIKQWRFPDYRGAVKSLGAWGGDFVLATGDKTDRIYFKKRGFNTLIPYEDMVL